MSNYQYTDRVIEHAPPPSPTAAALAALGRSTNGDAIMSPKRPRKDDPPSHVGTGATTSHPCTTTNGVRKAAMMTAMLQHKPHNTRHRAPPHPAHLTVRTIH
eukprot:scaffold47951_cov31-Tisochrysis_lutea.AAC.4